MALRDRAARDSLADHGLAIRDNLMLVVEDEKTPTGAQERGLRLRWCGWRSGRYRLVLPRKCHYRKRYEKC